MKRSLTMALLTASIVSGGCTDPISNHAEVGSVKIFDAHGTELTPIIVLEDVWTQELEVRFFDHNGARVELRAAEHSIAITGSPPSMITVSLVEGERFKRRVTVADPCPSTPAGLRVGYGHWGATNEHVFGPFPVVIRNPVDGATVTDTSGAVLERVELPTGDTLRIRVDLLNCVGTPYDEVPEGRTVRVLRSSAALVDTARVATVGTVFDLFTAAPPGTRGQISFVYGTDEDPRIRVFGPWEVEVTSNSES